MKQKFWIVRHHGNQISHRKLEPFEERNPSMFELARSAHGSWEEAHGTVIANRTADVTKLRRELKNAERQLTSALAMKPPTAGAAP